MSKHFHSWGLALLGGALLAGGVRAAEPAPDTVVARVGTEPITRGALVGYLDRFYGRAGLLELEQRSAVKQEAARYSITVTDADVQARAAELQRATGAKHQQLLDEEGISDAAWRERIRYSLLIEKVTDKKWPVTDADLQRYSVRYARLVTQNQARDLIREAKNGVDFRLLAFQRGLDKENEAYVTPNPFFRVDQPQFFKMTQEANLRPGQVTSQPIQSGKYWLVLKLERFLPADTLSAKERADASKRIHAVREVGLMDLLHRRYKPAETFDPEAASGKPEDVVATVGAEKINRRDLTAYMLNFFGRQGIQRLAERAVVTQQAAKLNLGISDAEVDARLAAVRKASGLAAFAKALEAEGISESAWKERVRYSLLAEKVVNARSPVQPEELTRLTVRYIRVPSRQEADAVVKALQMGAKFETVMAQASLDRNGDGYLRPKPLTKTENPEAFKLISDANLQPRQVLPTPVANGGSFVVLWLEGRQTAADMKPEERAAVAQRINALRLGDQLDAWKKEIRVEVVVPIEKLVAEARAS